MSFSLHEIDKEHHIYSGEFSLFPREIAVHGVSGRRGGVSRGQWSSLDLGLHVCDNPEDVIENRRRYLGALGLDAARLVTPEQVHGIHVERVGLAEAGKGAEAYADAIPRTDALITNVPNLPLLLCFADCTPILFLDPVHKAVGIAHGGWKGTVNRIGYKTVRRMQEEFGTQPRELLTAIGPSIGPCCYEIGPEVEAKFREAFPGHEAELFPEKSADTGKPHLSLWAANRIQLEEAGVLPEHIDEAQTCTSCHHDMFFSHRADAGKTGRLAAVIALRG